MRSFLQQLRKRVFALSVSRARYAVPSPSFPMKTSRPATRLRRLLAALGLLVSSMTNAAPDSLTLNDQEYLEMPGLNVMLAHDFYPESHQGGVGIIQHGLRVATNGDLRLDPTPGQWQPVPRVGPRVVDRTTGEISVRMQYPDPEKDRRGFNPIVYPDFHFSYVVRVRPEGAAFRIFVDLDSPLPAEWVGRVGFNMEFFPGILFGRSFQAGETTGIFPRQPNGPGAIDAHGDYQLAPLATGRRLVIAPEISEQRLAIEAVRGGELQLLDGRAQHTNGWFVVRALVPGDVAHAAIEWLVTPHVIPGWKSAPVVQISQVGYHPRQEKIAVIETDARESDQPVARLLRVTPSGLETVLEKQPPVWGKFLRYRYLQFDFTEIAAPGAYLVEYGVFRTSVFQIRSDIFQRHVWQPTLEYFLPVQMCHMRINDRYRVWHDCCHLDDARMAPVNHNHFDGYVQGPSTLTRFAPGEPVPGLNRGGWHDAGDYDLRVESLADTLGGLALAYECFNVTYDNTTIDQEKRVVEIHQPDGKPDILQQIEHGALSLVSGYKALGRLYRGIIEPTLRQYVMLGDAVSATDNHVHQSGDGSPADDRWVFTEDNPRRELAVAAQLAAASRALKDFNPELSRDCLTIAQTFWRDPREPQALGRLSLATELLIATGDREYADWIVAHAALIAEHVEHTGWIAARALPHIDNDDFKQTLREAVKRYRAQVDAHGRETPYGLPYKPDIWGAGWGIQQFGMRQYFLHTAFPDIFPDTYLLKALNFVLGCHPGPNTASFASGVGAHSLTTAYGVNRADWSYIPGGIGSGTALIRPDFPEMLHWPFLWQQTEYCLGGPTVDYLFLVLAADRVLNRE